MINLTVAEKKKRQRFLKERGWYAYNIDGSWETESKKATKKFQTWAKPIGHYCSTCVADGDWGNETEKAYKITIGKTSTTQSGLINVSSQELLIPYGTFYDMELRYKKFVKNNSKEPTTIYLVAGGKNYITLARFKDMQKRVIQWNKENPKELLKNVWIKKPTTTTNVLTNEDANNIPTININGKNYKPSTFTKFYGLMGGFGYSYYYNDIYTLSQEISRVSTGKALNCTDFAQFGVYIASQYKKNGKKVYETRYVHINCKGGGGHTTFQIRGGEFGSVWTMIDLAAKADKNSRTYPIGDYWCRSGVIRGYNELWVLSDDGKT